MARLGSTKAKTGCFTCKARKVKCDETKPSCRRCTRTQRTCPGYPEVTGQAQYSWAQLLAGARNAASQSPHLLAAPSPPLARSPSSIITADVQESRALAFFRAQVAPALSRHSSASFWTVLLAQVSRVEPSVRHALAAISALYEERLLRSAAASAAGAEKSMRMERVRFAVGHYSQALGYVKAAGVDRNIVLLVCLLFICIEAMQDDKQMAIQHCRHGILICNNMPAGLSGWAKDELQPIFLRLATFPYFFGMEAGDFPEPVGLVSAGVDSEEAGFDTSSGAWDYLVNRAVRVIRMGLSHRQGPLRWSTIPDILIDEQLGTLASLTAWRQYLQLQRNSLAVPDEEYESHLFREMECITGQVWVACCIDHSEMTFDGYMVDFEALLSLSQELIDRRISATEPRRIFSFEMGFMPIYYFIVLKCRRLDLRIRALQHILLVAYDQENLFSTRLLYTVGLRLTELENGVKMDPAWPEQPDAALEGAPMPVDEVRVRTADITEEKETRVDETGEVSEFRKVYFLVRPEAIVPGYMEWVKVRPS